ncbi:aryl-sulfate sulfotransferase [Shewanella indica]|uniref:aryl-sulfate sulfotransferase n=1 Tax=Shewanella TaxID=22 RepID=UPI000C33B9A4|nr:aryl-sulfate sulfotransferase [Shewanella indica]
MKKSLTSLAVVLGIGLSASVSAAGFYPAPPAGNLGGIIVNPYGNSPLTALVDLGSKRVSDVSVTVAGKGKNGVSISYPVGPKTINRHDGIPIFGLYADYKNQVSVNFTLDGKKYSDKYEILTSALENKYIDNRNITSMQEVKVKKVDKNFKDRLLMVNSHTMVFQGSDLHWSGVKGKDAGIFESTPALGAMTFDMAPLTYIIDTQGETRWWLDQDATYNGRDIDVNKRGYLMGLRKDGRGNLSFVQGQHFGYLDLMGKIVDFKIPRGYQDLSHESITMPNGNLLLRGAKTNYVNPQGDKVHTVRDHILEVDQQGNLVDVWDLNKILDPYRDALLKALDMGAVCVNVDLDHAGQAAGEMKIDAPYGDIPGIAAGRNWAHVNSISYDPKDDGIILSLRHQGVVKITRDKQVKWILTPSIGWKGELAKKLLKPVDAKGKAIACSEQGDCQGDFDFTYTQHTAWLSSKGTLTVFDNGDGRHYTQPALPTQKYSRFVEYKIDENNMTVQQIWEYGKERGYEWYSPITSNVEYVADHNTIFGFGGSINLFEPGRVTGKFNEIDYRTKEVKLEIDVLSDKAGQPHYRGLFIEPAKMFGR